MKPSISIIMPMYGVEAYIARAIESVQRQTFTDWELLIVNDGSKDRSREIAAGYEKQDGRIHIIDKPNGGLTSARLKGLEFAQGEYLSFIDSDDTLHPDYLQVLYSNIQKYDADVSMCSYYTVNGANTISHTLYFNNKTTIIEKDFIFRDYFLPQVASAKRGSIFLPSFMWLRMFRREVVSENMFVSEREVYQEDLAFSARIFSKLNRVVVVNEPCYNYHVNMGSLTQKYRDNAWGMMQSLTQEIENVFRPYPGEKTEERQKSSILFAAHFALMNETRLEYASFKRLFNSISQDKNVRSAISSFPIFGLRHGLLCMIFSMRLRWPCPLYIYNSRRV